MMGMRRGRDCNLLGKEGVFIGVNLGADYTAEHEWGIEYLKSDLGIPVEGVGISGRTIGSEAYQHVKRLPLKDGEVIYLSRNGLDYALDRELFLRDGEDLACGWSDSTFAIRATKKHATEMETLWQAFQRGDVAVWRGGGGMFQNAGLVIVIASLIPADGAEAMAEADRDRARLIVAAKATGIEERLRAAKRRWFALSPRWADEEKKAVKFWLNPTEQDQHHAGWFTVEQLDEWAAGKGPVMKRRSRRADR